MKSVIVGTAGHIDHGKTALVKALTGIDADRLAEEKRRGITIDLGFAHLEVAGKDGERIRFGFVDVPGHERFVRNMLAGVGGIDLVLLVIAADEGIKPQTREHFEICKLLRIPRGITVLTKSDTVDAETLEVVRLEVEDFLRGSFLQDSPLAAVSSITGTGLDELKDRLVTLAAKVPQRAADAIARLPIDRVFVMKGHGTVVTGTLISGCVTKEDELQLFPSGRRVRVRSVQVHNRAAEHAAAGERTALNLAGVESAELTRGMMLVAPGLLGTTARADVSLTLLEAARPLKDRSRVHLHCYAAETIAEITLIGDSGLSRELKPGASSFARLKLAEPLQLLPGDHFIIRQFSPVVTIGGGEVLDVNTGGRVTLPKSGQEAFLKVLVTQHETTILRARVARYGHNGATMRQLIAETGWTAATITRVLSNREISRSITRIGERAVQTAALQTLQAALLNSVKQFHHQNPLATGINREELRSSYQVVPEIFDHVLGTLVAGRQVEVAADQVRVARHVVAMKDDEAAAKERIEKAFASAGLKVPLLKDVMASLPVDRARAQKILTLLLRERVLIKLGDELVFHRSALEGLRAAVQQRKQRSAKIDVAAFKELTGVSRKYAIPLLEYLDRERVTRRVGDERVIL